MVAKAKQSVDIAANVGFAFTHVLSRLTLEDLLSHASPNARLRCILGTGTATNSQFYVRLPTASSEPAITRWNFRMVQTWQGEHVVIVDAARALISRRSRDPRRTLAKTTDAIDIQEYALRFEEAWLTSEQREVLYELPASPRVVGRADIRVVSATEWNYVLHRLRKQPELMRRMPPRSFEELVAELLERQGLRVRLTPPSNDGGRDILAFANTPLGEHLYLVECKRYAQDRPVGVELVRQLYGVVEFERANAGLLVTTSTFTTGAIELQRTLGRRIALKDYADLSSWLITS
jgi:hypothetical protein